MRVNAPITAILALAALSLSTPLQAHPTHTLHKTPTHTPTDPPAKKHAKKKPAAPATAAKSKPKAKPKARKHRQTVEDIDPPTVVRIHHKTPAAKPPQKATASDFLQAASAPEAAKTDDAPEADQKPQPPVASHAKKSSTSKPVSVVSVIRPDTQHPILPSIEEQSSTPVILPSLYNKRGRLIVPPALKGSHEILIHQNLIADNEGLSRIQDDEDIIELRRQNLLVPIPTGPTLLVDDRLPTDRRYCRPWAAQFLSTMARAYYARFHTPLQVNSAVRTVEFQQRLLHTNGNAAPAEGDTASPHLTGQAVDLAKHGLSLTQIAWMRGYLLPLVQQGKVDVEEEFQQACFHISIYKKYLPPPTAPRRNLATTHHPETGTLAAAVD